jgi:hypothetical protein
MVDSVGLHNVDMVVVGWWWCNNKMVFRSSAVGSGTASYNLFSFPFESHSMSQTTLLPPEKHESTPRFCHMAMKDRTQRSSSIDNSTTTRIHNKNDHDELSFLLP